MVRQRGNTDFWARLRSHLKEILATLREANVPGLAAQVAYSLIFALPALLLLLTLVVLNIDQRTHFTITATMRRAILLTLPSEVQQVVTGLLDDALIRASVAPTTFSAIVSIIVALLLAGNGLGALSMACCTVAGIEDTRSGWVRRVLFTGSALLLSGMLIGAFALLTWGADLARSLGMPISVPAVLSGAWDWLQVPVLLLLIFAGITLLFMTGTGRYDIRPVAPGAAVATLLWVLVGKGFQLYLTIAQPGTAYGAASSALVLLVFLYLSAIVLIVGGLIAAVMSRNGPDQPSRRSRDVPHEGSRSR